MPYVRCIDLLSALREKNSSAIAEAGRISTMLSRLLSYLVANLVVEVGKTSGALSLSCNTMNTAVKRLCELGILSQTTGNHRNRAYSYTEYLSASCVTELELNAQF